MGKLVENPELAAPINPLYMYSNITNLTFSNITSFFRHQLVVICEILLYVT